ncbi:glycosyltransferase [Acidithiobacillus albertensis]|uniref:glycosyltransferase n=1 Tax=Acidithiobacillus albertensis TaxID=119978 RepID=UPI000981F492|nr:glycosyltransferase [Acidithiobacillus albertensis]
MRILQVTPYPTLKPIHGGQIRASQISHALRMSGHKVKSIALYDENYNDVGPEDIKLPNRSNPWNLCESILSDYFGGEIARKDIAILSALRKIVDEFEPRIIIVEQPWFFSAVQNVVKSNSNIKLVYSSQNVEWRLKNDLLQRYGCVDRDLLVEKIRCVEESAARAADLVVACTNEDLLFYENIVSKKNFNGILACNGVEPFSYKHEHVLELHENLNKKLLVFVSSAHLPNVHGFWEMIGLDLSFLMPDEKVLVIGSVGSIILNNNIQESVSSIDIEKFFIAGVLEKVELHSLVSASHIVLLPITCGEGSNLKTAEALESGLPIVATSKAMRGYEDAMALDHVYIADNQESFRAAIRTALDKPRKTDLTPQGIRSKYYWSNTLEGLIKSINRLSGASNSELLNNKKNFPDVQNPDEILMKDDANNKNNFVSYYNGMLLKKRDETRKFVDQLFDGLMNITELKEVDGYKTLPDCTKEEKRSSVIDREDNYKIPFGVNIIGYISGNLGLGVFARSVVSSLLNIGVKVSILDVDPGHNRWRHDISFDYLSLPPEKLQYSINIFLFPPETMSWLLPIMGNSLRIFERVNVLWTMWELPKIPREWYFGLQLMDLIMGGSPFVTASVATSLDGPIVLDAAVPHVLPVHQKYLRDHFLLPEDKIVFLSAYEPFSDPQRKNPFAAIDAFRRGVGNSQKAILIIKVNSTGDYWREELLRFIANDSRIIIFEKLLSYDDTISLYNCCDVFISLHRAEGFGLVPLEFMALGKPVIATAWSGNMAYMDADCACLVSYKLIPVNGSIRAYQTDFIGSGVQWADPSVEEAAVWIEMLLNNSQLRSDIGQKAAKAAAIYFDKANKCEWLIQLVALSNQYNLFPQRRRRKELAFSKLISQNDPWLLEFRSLGNVEKWAKEWTGAKIFPVFQALCFASSLNEKCEITKINLKNLWYASSIKIYLVYNNYDFFDSIDRIELCTNSDWLILIDAGDQLAPDAIFRIQMAVQNHPEWQLIYTDEDSLTADGQHVNPHCKPDFNIDYLRSLPYIGGLLVIKKELFEALGGFDPQADGAEDYDFVLRAWEKIGDAGIGHIPEVLYHRLQGGGHCNKSVEEILQVSQAALQRHLQRLNIAAEVLPGPFPPATRVRYPLTGTPLVSIIIPTRNQLGYLQRCVESLIEKTRYAHYEILIVDNDSDDAEARTYLDMLKAQEEQLGGRLRVLRHPGPFNFSAMNNRAVEQARGDYVLLLNNDTAALHDDWLDEMVSQILRPEVGIVGAKLLFPDGKIQHAGVILGMRGPAEHPFIGQPPEYRGYFGRAMLTQNLSAVTGACLLIKKSLYQELGGLDEKQFQVSYNDIDLCLKAREAGHKIVFTPWAMLLHEGSASQRGEVEKKPSPEKEKRFAGEKMAFYQKWLPQLAFDPAYNRHLSLASTDFLLEDQAALTWDPEWRPRPRILVHPADREGCGEYRIISPMRALQKAGRAQGWETMRIFEPAEMERFSPESIVLQRQMEWPQIEALERHKKLLKTFRVFEIDDLITNLPVKSLHKAQIHKDIAKRFRKAAGLCNRLVVATEPLAKAYKGFADEVRVQPNCIEEAIWGSLQPRRRAEAKPRVGWAGGVGHTGDLEMIADVVRDLADEVDWVFFGLCPDALRPYVREFHTGVPLPQYPNKLASLDLDLALAPLENNSFNEAKSHLRILEYGILGYPVICSDIFPYQGDFPVTRVANRYRDWVRAIREQIADRQALATAGDHLREYVRAHWLLEEHLDDWLAAWLP